MTETTHESIKSGVSKRTSKKPFPVSSKVNMARYTKTEGIYPYFVPLSTQVGPRVMMNNRETIMLGSNNYLGLANHPKMIKAAIDAIKKYGTGCTGSRFLNGTLDLHVKLEEKLAKFMGKEGAICFSTGMQANLGVISGITAKNDVILSDEKNHGSIIDGCKLSPAETIVYKHNDMEDLEKHLETVRCKNKDNGNCWVISDGVFSMEGNLAQTDIIVELAEKYDARVIIDDAHGVGHMGHHGEGSVGYFNLMDKVDLVVGTFSKSFASIGGFVVGDEELIEHLRHHARSLIFSAAIPPSAAATALQALKIFYKADDLRAQLRKNTARFRHGVEHAGFNTLPGITPVVPIIIGDVMKMLYFNRDLLDAGVYVNPVVPPAVPKATVRTSLMATHSEEDIDEAIEILEQVAKKNRILK